MGLIARENKALVQSLTTVPGQGINWIHESHSMPRPYTAGTASTCSQLPGYGCYELTVWMADKIDVNKYRNAPASYANMPS